jgi:hypothetical protein
MLEYFSERQPVIVSQLVILSNLILSVILNLRGLKNGELIDWFVANI